MGRHAAGRAFLERTWGQGGQEALMGTGAVCFKDKEGTILALAPGRLGRQRGVTVTVEVVVVGLVVI